MGGSTSIGYQFSVGVLIQVYAGDIVGVRDLGGNEAYAVSLYYDA